MNTIELNKLTTKKSFFLNAMNGLKPSYHQFDTHQVAAIQAAFYAQRPLLVTGDPGLGKSQIAHAIASVTESNLFVHVVHSRTEPDDLLFRVDHVARLAQAQLVQHEEAKKEVIKLERFVVPGPLWWAYAPGQAKKFFEQSADYNTAITVDLTKPNVLLIDEIDKADSDLPNALLEVLNNQSFHATAHDKPIQVEEGNSPPFVVVTSNNQRPLPHAFLRRCVVLELTLEAGDTGIEQLTNIANAHKQRFERLTNDFMQEVAELVITTRAEKQDGDYLPGTSEYLDLLKVLNDHPAYVDHKLKREALESISQYMLHK